MGGTPRGIDTEERAKAGRVRTRLAKEIEHIQSRRNLSSEGKRAQLAKVVVQARDELVRLRDAESARVAARRDELTRGLFGATRPDDSRVISLRDAADRASRVSSSEEAARLMNAAELNGDTVLLRVLAQECFQRSGNPLDPGWRNLFDQWAQQQPGGDGIVEELGVIADELNDTGHRLAREEAFGIPALPGELSGVNLRAHAALADIDGD